jgi:hypothetical protein
MGRWLELLRERPPLGADDYAQRRSLLIGEIAPHPLLWAALCLSRERRQLFPALDRVREDSTDYIDEKLWLDARQAGELLQELRRLRRTCQRQKFLTGMDGRRYYDLWRRGESPEQFEEWLDQIEALLAAAQGDDVLLFAL